MRKDHPLAAKDTVAPADMEGQDMIGKGRAYDCFRKSVETLLLGAGVNVSIPVETPDEELLQVIRSEANAFFAGQKSAGEAARQIQSRLSIYVAEQG